MFYNLLFLARLHDATMSLSWRDTSLTIGQIVNQTTIPRQLNMSNICYTTSNKRTPHVEDVLRHDHQIFMALGWHRFAPSGEREAWPVPDSTFPTSLRPSTSTLYLITVQGDWVGMSTRGRYEERTSPLRLAITLTSQHAQLALRSVSTHVRQNLPPET